MKILALSDIHGNLAAVRKLRHQESNDFDVIVVAGDIGGDVADLFFDILSTFECPVLYIYGNWDNELGYRRPFGERYTHLHMKVIEIGDMAFAGFSGCPTHWGRNAIAVKKTNEVNENHKAMFERHADVMKNAELADHRKRSGAECLWNEYRLRIRSKKIYKGYEEDMKCAWKETLAMNKQALFKKIISSGVDPERTIIVTHERLTRLDENIPGIHCHLFGHAHGFKYNQYKGTHCINVSVLDRLLTIYPKSEGWSDKGRRNVNGGTYAIIETDGAEQFTVRCEELQFDSENWEIDQYTSSGPPWFPGEEAFAESRSLHGRSG